MLRSALLAASRSAGVRKLVERSPLTRPVVSRFIPGDDAATAVLATQTLADKGMFITLDHLGEDCLDAAQAQTTVDAYLTMLTELATAGLAARAEVSVKLSAVGQFLPVDGEATALRNARAICEKAAEVGTTVTLDMEDHTTTDSTLSIARELRKDFPWLGVVLQAYLHRTEADCREFSGPGSRVRLCKGAYKEPATVAHQSKAEIDKAYVRCLRILMQGEGYPMVASHDPRLIDIADSLAAEAGRKADSYEYQMLFGIRPEEQQRIADRGDTMRIYLAYGSEWYGYFMRRLAERPANVTFFLRSILSKN